MIKHLFIFQQGFWVGEGKITFSMSDDVLMFFTKWTFLKSEGEKEVPFEIKAVQDVELLGGVEKMKNFFTFSDIKSDSFTVTLENELVVSIKGKGIIDDKTIGWEFRDPNFEGFEIYELKEKGEDYSFHAEYMSGEKFRSIIDGNIWKKEKLLFE